MRRQILVADASRSWTWSCGISSRGSSVTGSTGRLGQDNDAAGTLALVLISKGPVLVVACLVLGYGGLDHLVGKGFIISTIPIVVEFQLEGKNESKF